MISKEVGYMNKDNIILSIGYSYNEVCEGPRLPIKQFDDIDEAEKFKKHIEYLLDKYG